VSPRFRVLDPAVPPASDLIAAVLAEYDVAAGRQLQGGPSATAADFSPPRGAYVVGFVSEVAVCGGGIKDLGSGVAELKRMYVTPPFRGRGIGQALLGELEVTARGMGYQCVRLDSKASTWPIYLAAGYAQLPNYNDNPHADFWGEKPL
jgi:GNAT superfamily N-acetyltransferase